MFRLSGKTLQIPNLCQGSVGRLVKTGLIIRPVGRGFLIGMYCTHKGPSRNALTLKIYLLCLSRFPTQFSRLGKSAGLPPGHISPLLKPETPQAVAWKTAFDVTLSVPCLEKWALFSSRHPRGNSHFSCHFRFWCWRGESKGSHYYFISAGSRASQ